MAEGRKPDFVLKAMNKDTDARTPELGVGWMNDDASISIRMNPGCFVPHGREWVVTLFPNNRDPAVKPRPLIRKPPKPAAKPLEDFEDDIPF